MDLSQLINVYRGPLIGLIASWGAPWADAVEIAQDSFAEAYLNRESCKGDWQDSEVFGRWLRGVAKNQYRNWARSRRRRQNHVAHVSPDALEQLAANSQTETADSDEHLVQLRQAIDQLPTKQRQVVLMHYLEESSVGNVAALLSISNKAVEGRLYQARRTLRRMLDKKTSGTSIGMRLLCL